MSTQNDMMDKVLKVCVDEIFEHYDDDKNGTLDKEECKKFIMSAIEEMGVGPDNEVFNENDFEECFKKVDVDGSGTIDKDEMFKFIKIASGSE